MYRGENITYQYNLFILQVAICNIVNTKQTKTQRHSINLLHTGRDDAIYATFNTQSGSVQLSCPPERRWLSLLLTGEQPARASKRFPRVMFHTWATAGGCEMFLSMAICSTCCKVCSQAPGTAVVLVGQDSKTGKNGN